MILVWDNGGSHSDHQIHFIDIGDEDADEVVKLLKLSDQGRPDSALIATAPEMTWRADAGLSKLPTWVEETDPAWDLDDRADEIRALSNRMLDLAAEAWALRSGTHDLLAERLRRKAARTAPGGASS